MNATNLNCEITVDEFNGLENCNMTTANFISACNITVRLHATSFNEKINIFQILSNRLTHTHLNKHKNILI